MRESKKEGERVRGRERSSEGEPEGGRGRESERVRGEKRSEMNSEIHMLWISNKALSP